MKLEDYQFFQQNGYLSLGKVLTDGELEFYLHLYDQDRKEKKQFWFDYGHHHQTANYDVLVSTPEFDGLIRHPKVIKPLSDLMGGDICFSEIVVRHMKLILVNQDTVFGIEMEMSRKSTSLGTSTEITEYTTDGLFV